MPALTDQLLEQLPSLVGTDASKILFDRRPQVLPPAPLELVAQMVDQPRERRDRFAYEVRVAHLSAISRSRLRLRSIVFVEQFNSFAICSSLRPWLFHNAISRKASSFKLSRKFKIC